jgi:alkylation response protein AidB-like acyl-CoA dehydrogenase
MRPYALTEEHDDFRASVSEFAADQLAPHVERWNAAHQLPVEAVKQMADFGLFGLGGPEEYGGAGDFTSLCIAIEEIGRVDQSLGITLEAAVGLGVNPIARFGSPEQKQRWLPDLIAGHALAAFGLTEPGSGSDALAMRTRADRGQQAVHHQQRNRSHLDGHHHRPDRDPVERQAGDLHHHRPQRYGGDDDRTRVREARLVRLGHPSGDL